MLATTVRAPLVLAGLLGLGSLAAVIPRTAPTPTQTITELDIIETSPPIDQVEYGSEMPDGVYATLKTMGDPPRDPWAPVGCNVGGDVELDITFVVADGIARVSTATPLVWHPLTPCMEARVNERIGNLRRLAMPLAGYGPGAVHTHITVHAQEPDSVWPVLRHR